jgi:hypothetical protein
MSIEVRLRKQLTLYLNFDTMISRKKTHIGSSKGGVNRAIVKKALIFNYINYNSQQLKNKFCPHICPLMTRLLVCHFFFRHMKKNQ